MSPARTERSLQSRLLGWLLVPLLVLLALDTAFSSWSSTRLANLAHDRSLHEIARELAVQVRADGGVPRLDLSEMAKQILFEDAQDQIFYRVATAEGRLLGGETEFAGPPHGTRRNGARFYSLRLHGKEVRAVAAWLPYPGARTGELVFVQVAETTNKRGALANEMLLNTIAPQLLLILLAVGAVYVGVSRGLAPVRRVSAAVSSRSHVDLSPIEVDHVPAEVRPLLDEVNELMARVRGAIDAQNRFIADAAHQLKTPVSGLKAQIELGLREQDPQRLHHNLAQVYVSVERLSRLVRQLLALARNEPGVVQAAQLQVLDLRALALDVAMEWVSQGLRAGIDLGFEGEAAPLPVKGDGDRLREMLNNLIDNAIRYSHRGGRVTVGAGKNAAGTHAVIAISDDSARIAPEERQRIFERFHRTLGTKADGSGLGLSIVSEIAMLHGASIELEDDSDGVGNRFSVVFPLAADD
ncbi:sensor histidine kinase [Ramlibacter sp.]|uniref:sensor histidine kinase n=1 Tax=Ramlibacter sp. TaxID=1917967 RepID=UPI003D09BD13